MGAHYIPHPSLHRWLRPATVRTYAFIDGMNLFNAAKRCFQYRQPNCDYARLVNAVVNMEGGRQLERAAIYVGIPKAEHDASKNTWWNRKLAATGRSGVQVVRRYLKKRELTIDLGGIVHFKHTVPRLIEKGIDLKLGLDLVHYARNGAFDLAIIFSQDGDLVEAVEEVHRLAGEQNRWIQVECAYPFDPLSECHPINRTVQRRITRAIYDACLDPTDYR